MKKLTSFFFSMTNWKQVFKCAGGIWKYSIPNDKYSMESYECVGMNGIKQQIEIERYLIQAWIQPFCFVINIHPGKFGSALVYQLLIFPPLFHSRSLGCNSVLFDKTSILPSTRTASPHKTTTKTGEEKSQKSQIKCKEQPLTCWLSWSVTWL